MPYDETQVRAFAAAIYKFGDAVKKDGLGADDADEAVGVLTALSSAVDEAKDTDAFACHLISELGDLLGDRLVDKPAE